MKQYPIAIAAFFLAACHAVAWAEPQKVQNPLEEILKIQPYVRCTELADGVRLVRMDKRKKDSPAWRELSVGGSSHRVSIADGARLMYAYPGSGFFANLKVERSTSDSYLADKDIVRKWLAETAKTDGNLELHDAVGKTFTTQSVTRRTLTGNTLAITQLFSDDDRMIVTMYFLNQIPAERRLKTLDEFASHRNSFVRSYSECVGKK